MNRTVKNYEEALQEVQEVISFYNEQQPHGSIDFHTPQQAQGKQGELSKRWKPKARRDDPVGFIRHEA